MLNRKTILITVSTALLASFIQSCTANQSPSTESPAAEAQCRLNDVATICILESAVTTLGTIENGFNWVTSATELAIAMDSSGDKSGAWALLSDAVKRLDEIEDLKKRGTATADIALALKSFEKNNKALEIIEALKKHMQSDMSDASKTDIECKIVTAIAVHDSPIKARELALNLSDENDTANAFKGRTQREISAIFAKKGDFKTAIAMLEEITADFDYYKAIAHTDVMSIAAKAGKNDIVTSLTAPAETIANSQDNGYFASGVLRDIAHSYISLGDIEQGKSYIEKALMAAKAAPKFQEKARSISRISTRLSDARYFDETSSILQQALTFARQEKSAAMQTYSLYEISGSAAFSGHTDMSKELVIELPQDPFGSSSSLKAAGQRDLAWGLVRSGKLKEGVIVANDILTPREKIHALSRIVRVLNTPKMDALPRYL